MRHARDGLRSMAPKRLEVQTRVCQQPDDQGRWTVRTLAAELGLPASTVHGMLVAANLQPHHIRTFTFSPDPDFEAKLLELSGYTSIRPRMPLCCAWMRNRAFGAGSDTAFVAAAG